MDGFLTTGKILNFIRYMSLNHDDSRPSISFLLLVLFCIWFLVLSPLYCFLFPFSSNMFWCYKYCVLWISPIWNSCHNYQVYKETMILDWFRGTIKSTGLLFLLPLLCQNTDLFCYPFWIFYFSGTHEFWPLNLETERMSTFEIIRSGRDDFANRDKKTIIVFGQ